MTRPIKNKVTMKLYGDQQLEHDIVKWLEAEKGLKAYGRVAGGNPYTTQKGDKGWAATVTFFSSDDSKGSVQNTSRIVKDAGREE